MKKRFIKKAAAALTAVGILGGVLAGCGQKSEETAAPAAT